MSFIEQIPSHGQVSKSIRRKLFGATVKKLGDWIQTNYQKQAKKIQIPTLGYKILDGNSHLQFPSTEPSSIFLKGYFRMLKPFMSSHAIYLELQGGPKMLMIGPFSLKEFEIDLKYTRF
ncbi:MAG: hypothetical protein JRJ86_22705 [Deltaproteobacteria bacterium]|nr:hypothetical protein [Deltaproteobacteria bacterium]MBW2345208.1 hypothetical protein [Deltaproteobacteria bacterium]